jgi:hypothetical protein
MPYRGVFRWRGKDHTLRPLLWKLLDYLLGRRSWPVPFDDVIAEVWRDTFTPDIDDKTLMNRVSDLNSALERLGVPISFRCSGGNDRLVHKEGDASLSSPDFPQSLGMK